MPLNAPSVDAILVALGVEPEFELPDEVLPEEVLPEGLLVEEELVLQEEALVSHICKVGFIAEL